VGALALVAGLLACGDSEVAGPELPRAAGLEGRWVLVALQEAGGPELAAPPSSDLTTEFRSAIVGIDYGCGSCGGSHVSGETSIRINAVTCADIAVCPAYNETYVRLVLQSRNWTAGSDSLELVSDLGRVRFRR
jgi:hypothetical protein